MSSMRWTEAQLNEYLARGGRLGTLDADRVSAPSGERSTGRGPSRARAHTGSVGSPLEHELYGHLTVMQLAPETQYRFHPERKWRLDFAFPDVLVGVEVDGGVFAAENGQTAGRHARGKGIIEGFEKRNAAAELGWSILCYGPPQVKSGEAALQIERIVSARRASGPGFALTRPSDGTVQDALEEQHARKPRARRRRKLNPA